MQVCLDQVFDFQASVQKIDLSSFFFSFLFFFKVYFEFKILPNLHI